MTYSGYMTLDIGWTDPSPELYGQDPPGRYAPRRGEVLRVFADPDCAEWIVWHDIKTGRTYTEAAW